MESENGNGSGTACNSDVLILDDNELTARALGRVLEKEGYQPVVTLLAAHALVEAEKRHFRAAVLDIHLPDMNGLTVARKLREKLGEETVIIMLSGDTSMATLKSLPEVGATYFFSKPLNTSLFVSRLKEWLRPESTQPSA